MLEGAIKLAEMALVTLPMAAVPVAVWVYLGIRADDEARAKDRANEMRIRLHHKVLP